MSYYSWYLHGSNSVNIYYGSCSAYTQSCTTGGWWTMDNTANTLLPTDGAYFTEDALKGGGVDARMIDHKVRLLQDITGATDPTKATLPCTTSTAYGSGPHCSTYSKPVMTTGNWYYFQIDFVDQPIGYPNSSFQIQTRRWQVINSSNWQLLAYATGG
ncbi:MAG: hypothetical protein QOE58_1088 [Actinomycetota bacterium]|nr:hypothetical protein [Actinomycetota bacterium]